MILRQYQEAAVSNVAKKLAAGVRKIVLQLSTGAGKTVIFSAISQRYITKNQKSVLILVHRKELLQQTRRTLFTAYGISAQVIIAGMRTVPVAPVYVGMIESTIRRIPKNIGLVIIDECHFAAFHKIHEHFTEQYIIGFTATPLCASKTKPLKMFYNDIVCGIDIPDLIKGGHLCQNITYAPKDTVDRKTLKIKNGEFDEGLMALQFKKPKYINNTIIAYEKWARGTKTIIFNVNIDHSIAVTNAFSSYNCKHLDSTMPPEERTKILQWFKETPDAILNNVGILVAGFDEPSIETVIFNKSTMSMPMWIQCTGRASRPTESKSAFVIIDMGGNANIHGDWCDSRDWYDKFHNPPKKGDKDGIAPVKNCPECDAIIPSQSRICKHCGYEFPPAKEELEEELSDFVVVTKGIDVRRIIEDNRDKKEYYPFFKIGKDLARQAKNTIPSMTDENAEFILDRYNELAQEWTKASGKKFNKWHQDKAKEHLFYELQNCFPKWQPKISVSIQA